MPNDPLTDAALAELDRLHGEAMKTTWVMGAAREVFNAYPALRQRLTDAEARLAEAERERDAALEHAVSMQNDRDGAVYSMIINGCRIDDGALAARDARMKREGAIEALEDIAKDEGIDGGKAYIAKVVYREFPDVMHTSVGVVDASDLMAAAKRLREEK